MKILINGSSVSSGTKKTYLDPNTGFLTFAQPTWPYCLRKKINCDITNLALPGAGNTYIHNSTITEISQRSYDLVLIMWTDFNRLDYRVQNFEQFSSLNYTSKQQSALIPNNEIEYIQQDWIFFLDYRNGNLNPQLAQLFGYNEFVNADIQYSTSLINTISLQGVLKSLNIPYRFMFYKGPVGLHRFSHLNNLIDWQNVINDPHLFSLAHKNNWWDHSTNHPTDEAYSAYADILADYLKNQELI
jgi:hypothetical protein